MVCAVSRLLGTLVQTAAIVRINKYKENDVDFYVHELDICSTAANIRGPGRHIHPLSDTDASSHAYCDEQGMPLTCYPTSTRRGWAHKRI